MRAILPPVNKFVDLSLKIRSEFTSIAFNLLINAKLAWPLLSTQLVRLGYHEKCYCLGRCCPCLALWFSSFGGPSETPLSCTVCFTGSVKTAEAKAAELGLKLYPGVLRTLPSAEDKVKQRRVSSPLKTLTSILFSNEV